MTIKIQHWDADSGNPESSLLAHQPGLASINSALKHLLEAFVYVFIIGHLDIK